MGNSIPKQLERNYGWKPDNPDDRDKYVTFKSKHYKKITDKVDLRKKIGEFPIYDQGTLGSCTANAICEAFEYEQLKQGLPLFNPSRLFVYYNERNSTTSPTTIRNGMKTINSRGICSESLWPYKIDYSQDKPDDKCYSEAKYRKSLKYKRIKETRKDLKASLSNGYPIIFGLQVYENFESKIGWDPSQEPMPEPDGKLLGGHTVLMVGYSDSRKCFLVRNSWGEQWGMGGYFMIPYDIAVSRHCSDFWILESVTSSEKAHEPEPEPEPEHEPELENAVEQQQQQSQRQQDTSRGRSRIRDSKRPTTKRNRKHIPTETISFTYSINDSDHQDSDHQDSDHRQPEPEPEPDTDTSKTKNPPSSIVKDEDEVEFLIEKNKKKSKKKLIDIDTCLITDE